MFQVSGSKCRVPGLGCRVSGLWFRISRSRFRASGSGFQVLGFGFRVLGFRVSNFGFRVSGSGFRVSSSGFQVSVVGFWLSDPQCQISSFGFRLWGVGAYAVAKGRGDRGGEQAPIRPPALNLYEGFGFAVSGSGFLFSRLGFGFLVSGFECILERNPNPQSAATKKASSPCLQTAGGRWAQKALLENDGEFGLPSRLPGKEGTEINFPLLGSPANASSNHYRGRYM